MTSHLATYTTRRVFLAAALVLLATATFGFAQPYPQFAVPPNPYNGYYQAYQPMRQAQYPYAYYGNSPTQAYMYAQRTPYVPYAYNRGNTPYYYVQNPYTQNPYNYSAPTRAADISPSPAPAWPAPVQATPPQEPEPAPTEVVDVPAPPRAPALNFRRPTGECFWIDAGYVATIIRPMHMNGPLLTTASAAETNAGSLTQPTTLVLFGDRSVDFGLFSGMRAELGLFLDSENRFSLDLSGLYLFANTQSYLATANQNGFPVISRPYFNVADGFTGQFRLANSFPGLLTGGVAVDARSQMGGLELNARYHGYVQDRYHIESLAGFRYLRFSESLRIREQVNPLPGGTVPFAGSTLAPPSFVTDEDNFRTVNQFIGPQLGARLTWEERWFSLAGFAKVGLGATLERTEIFGSTTMVAPTGSTTASGGVLALPSNSGTFNRAVFGLLPEFGIDLSANITPHIRVKAGYSVLLWNHVVRPGSQYDLNLNPAQINSSFLFNGVSGPSRPAYRFNEESFFSHSINLGLEVHF